MRLLGIAIEEFRSIRSQWLPADGLVVLFGPNSAGKTSVLEAAVELLRAGSHLRTDPGLLEDVWAQGSVSFTLPAAGISGSADAELYRALLSGARSRGRAWDDLASGAADLLSEKTADDVREWIASRLADAGQAGPDPDREILARSVLDPSVASFVVNIQGVFACADADRIPGDAMEAARRMAASEAASDPLREIAVGLCTERRAAIGRVADGEALADAFPPVIMLDGDPESLSAELRKALPRIHDLLWELRHPRVRIESRGYAQLVDTFAIRNSEDTPSYYFGDAWLERMSGSGAPEILTPEHVAGRGADWYRVRHSILAIAVMIENEANRAAPSFLQDQGKIGVEILPVSIWGQEDRRIRATFTGSDGEPRDLRVVGAGTARWAAAAVQLACRRLEMSHRVVTDPAGSGVSDLAAVQDIVLAARQEPLSQTAVRLEQAGAPGVYIVDEPEAHLHPRAVASVRIWLEELARTATAVFAATHSPMLLDTDSPVATRVLVLPRYDGTELQAMTGTMDESLAETADELGITKGDLLLMTRLVLFVEGLHDVIILSEWFGHELREAGIRVFPVHGGDNFQELAVTKPGLVGNEIIGALGVRMAIIIDKSPTRVEPTANRMLREAEIAGRDVTAVSLSEEDILFYLDEEVCREDAPRFPGWHAARVAARGSKAKWKTWVQNEYGLKLTPGNIRRLAAECRRQGRIPTELTREIQQLAALAATARKGGNAHRY
jgi:AAA domain, putative AbiEii toxin, Type IV TA system